MTSLKPSPAQTADSPTFRSRGVAAPFTAALLASARLRVAAHGVNKGVNQGLELILPNPTGSAGVFVTDWAGAAALRGATMHDTVLVQRLGRAGTLDPRSVREIALSVAEDGYAGPAAAASARIRRAADTQERQRVREALLPRGERQAEPPEHAIARALRIPVAAATAALQTCTEALGPLGLFRDSQDARLPRLLLQLQHCAQDIATWAAHDKAHDTEAMGAPIADSLRGACTMGRRFLEGLARWCGDPVSLLQRAAANPAAVREQADRALWLMDGWERPCLIWQAADTLAMRRLALLEIALALPVLPGETIGWTDPPVEAPPFGSTARVSYGGGTRLSGAAPILLTRRNETLRALSL